jgi:prepilin-type N-terminal cleavage/methylation domain-containing protein
MVISSSISSERKSTGFTLIELLVVISIIIALMGLGIATANVMRRQSLNTKTKVILSLITNAISSAGATRSQVLSTAEHPLASSAATRFAFARAADGTAVATAGDAIKTSDESFVAAGDRTRILRDDDVFADPIAPQFIGVPRWRMTIPGVTTKWVSRWLRVSSPGSAGTAIEPELGSWIDDSFMRSVVTSSTDTRWEASADKAFAIMLGPTIEELGMHGAIRRPDTTRDTLILSNRLRKDLNPLTKQGDGTWMPGTVNDGTSFVPYLIRGPAVVDAWNHEILIARTASGSLRLESAGADGCFRWHPGDDGILQTTATAASPDGDDKDATRDNIVLGANE